MCRRGLARRLRGLPEGVVCGRRVRVATTRRSRLLGLAGVTAGRAGGGLLIPRCRSVHTFGMRFDLDVLFLDAGGTVIRAERGVGPCRLLTCRRAVAVLELPHRLLISPPYRRLHNPVGKGGMTMRDKIKGALIAAAAIAALAVGGAAIAGATGGDDDGSEQAITGASLERASAAALAHTGGGEVTETEVGDEESYYEVEVTRADGSQVDVQLDRSFDVVGAAGDTDDEGGGGAEDE